MRDFPTRSDLFLYGAAICLGIAWFLDVLTLRFMQADGVHFFLDMLSRHDFEQWDYPRQFAHYITQAPMVLAMNGFHVRDVQLLAYLYGFGIYGVAPLSFVACLWVTPRSQNVYLALIAMAFAVFNLTTSFFVVSESSVASALFLFLFAFIVLGLPNRRPSRAQWALAAAAAIGCLRSYEFFCLLGPLLTWLVYRHWRTLGAPKDQLGRTVLALIAAAGVVAAVISVYYMFYSPVRTVQTVPLGKVLLALMRDPTVWACGLLMLLGAFLVMRRAPAWLCAPRTQLAMLLVGILLGIVPAIWPGTLASSVMHYHARLFHVALPIWIVMVTLISRQPQASPSFALLAPMVLLLSWNTVWQGSAGYWWTQYLQNVQTVLQTSKGFVPLEEITFVKDTDFTWSWTMPSLSIISAGLAKQPLHAIILSKKGDPYQPFDPRQVEKFPDMRDYGIVYAFEK